MQNEEIIRLYTEGASVREVAQACGCAYSTVSRIVRKSGLSRRKGPRKHISESKVGRCPALRSEFRDFLDGLIISDGCLDRPNATHSSKYSQSCVNKSWLTLISRVFAENGIQGKIGNERRRLKKSCWQFQTRRFDRLAKEYDRWYLSGAKSIPRDINVCSPILLRNWLYGDGTLIRGSTLRFCTDSFKEEDVEWLIDSLNISLGVLFRKLFVGWSDSGLPKFRVCICLRDGLDVFYDRIGQCELSCFSHKWR